MSEMTMPSEANGESVEEEVGRRSGYRRHSREFKERIVAEYDELPEHGGHRGSMLRRENLRRNQVSVWRRELAGEPSPSASPGRRAKRSPEEVELDRLRKANAKLTAELARTRLALEITGKAHALLEMLSESAASETRPQP